MTDEFYSFDTSAILNGRRDLFRPTVFHTLWAQIEDAIVAGQIRSVDEVKRELGRRDDDAKQWADAQSDLFVPLELAIQQSAAQILKCIPALSARAEDVAPQTRSSSRWRWSTTAPS